MSIDDIVVEHNAKMIMNNDLDIDTVKNSTVIILLRALLKAIEQARSTHDKIIAFIQLIEQVIDLYPILSSRCEFSFFLITMFRKLEEIANDPITCDPSQVPRPTQISLARQIQACIVKYNWDPLSLDRLYPSTRSFLRRPC